MSTAYTLLRDILCHQVFVNGSLKELSDATLMHCHLNMLDKCYYLSGGFFTQKSGKNDEGISSASTFSSTNIGGVCLGNPVIRTISKFLAMLMLDT